MSWFILHTRIQRSSCYIPQTEILFPIKKLKFCHFPGNLFLSKVESYVSSQADNKSQFINQHPLTESFLMEPKEQPGEINDSPIEKVRLTVPITDDTTLQALTFRTWVLGLTACICLAFSNQFFNYRQNHTRISITVFQIFVFPLGKLMAATLPKTPINIPGTKWTFSINPGPFNVKEHVLISTLCASGQEIPFAVEALAATKLFYHRKVHPLSAFLLTHTSQLVGYGCAGMFTKLLVNSPYMWWPSTLADATFYRTLHEAELRPKGQLTRLQFFIVAFVCSVTYHLVPNYFFPSITALSIVCWIWKDSVTAQQIGAGRKGLGIGSFAFDWSTISWLGSPLVVPLITIHNTMLGFILIVYIVAPIVYWTNSYNAKSFPIISSHLFDDHGQIYNITKIVNTERFELLQSGYEKYSKIYLSAFFANSYGFQFASISAGLTHVLVFHGREIWSQFKDAMQNNNGDIHNRMMKKYPSVPQWWYIVILFSMVSLTILTSIFSGSQFQFPWWGILFCVGMSLILILPTGIIQATTNAAPSFYIIMEVTVGYLYPGRPLGNLIFKTYYHVTQSHAKSFLESFKLGFYMKIPPRSMFIVQIVGTFVASSVSFGTAWWVFATVENVCDLAKLPKGSPWTCPGLDTFYDVSLLWGLIGPRHVFAPNGVYSNMYIFFVIGIAATAFVWILTRRFPNMKWIRSIHVPIILGACGSMPPVPSVSYWSWWIVGVFFNNIVYKKFKGWWAKYTYILSTAIEAGVAFLALLLFFTLQRKDIYGLNWWGLKFDDHCPLAHCPTAPGIQVEGCPVFH